MKKRVYLFVALCLLTLTGLIPTQAFAQNAVFGKYSDMEDVEYICITKWMLRHLKGADNSVTINGVKVQGLSNAIDVILIINSENRKVGEQMKNDFNTLKSDDNYKTLMVVKDNDSQVSTIFNDRQKTKELVMFINDDDEQTFIVLTGDLSDEMIEKLITQ
ncbi:MAG: DUF4252 domain-containing protein [Bacteroidales bacterium]|nr:DUF4252 domain-containing protein [Bacteroidales bacterium]